MTNACVAALALAVCHLQGHILEADLGGGGIHDTCPLAASMVKPGGPATGEGDRTPSGSIAVAE
jgi:hypothetical protein